MDIPPSGAVTGEDGIARCWWCTGDPDYLDYHDREWGRPVTDDRRLFEKISLEGFMSGLSWLTILHKRENFRRAFAGFDIETVAGFDAATVEALLGDAGIVRHRGKIEATINNAGRCLELIEAEGSLASYLWAHEPETSARSERLDWATLTGLGTAEEATIVSKDLKRRGWRFVGPTTIYSTMESVGMVNDHVSACDIRAEVEEDRATLARPRDPERT